MNDKSSAFGADPEQLDKLLAWPLDEDVEDISGASLDRFAEGLGSKIGHYRLLSVLGEGGMGIVYLAQQEEPVKRQVALKVIKPGMDSKRVIARFEVEKQALALMKHPNIAGVFDAGLTLNGRPYFVMEHVKGTPITDYCDDNKITIEDRLGLFVQVCQAVQHAHQKGIIHRDIKPSNILVSVENEQAIPKIIDFGVAKATDKLLTKRTLQTEDTQLLGTPEYMSPEQADMASEDIDIRSDVYSLGVLLYVLLAGILPFDSKILREGGIDQIRRTIRQIDPKTPSNRLTSLGEEAAKLAEMRGTEISTLTKNLKNELEWIPLKATRKDRDERYCSASELADDIENYLNGVPLIAGPPTTFYRLKKFVLRNTVLSVAALAVAMTLILGLAGTTTMYLRAERARDKEANARAEAERALSQAQAVSNFLIFDILDPESFSEGQKLDPDYLLDNAAQKVENSFKDQPLEEAKIRNVLGQRYLSIGKPEKAIQHMERAYQIRLKHFGPEDIHTMSITNMICWAYYKQDRYDDAIQLWSEQIEIKQKAHGEPRGIAILFMKNIGITYNHLGRYQEAEAWLDETLEFCESLTGTYRDYTFVMARLHLGSNYLAQGRYEEAEQVLTKALEDARQRWGANNVKPLQWTTVLLEVYREQGKYDKAQQLCGRTLDTMRQELGEEHSVTLKAMCCLGRIYLDQESFDEAEKLFREALRGQRLKIGDEDGDTFASMNNLAVLLTKQKQYEEAESLFYEALYGLQRKFGDNHPQTLKTKNHLAVLYKEQGQYEKAEPLFVEALEGRRLKLGEKHPHTLESMKNLIALYEAWNKPEKAKEWRTKLPQTEAKTE